MKTSTKEKVTVTHELRLNLEQYALRRFAWTTIKNAYPRLFRRKADKHLAFWQKVQEQIQVATSERFSQVLTIDACLKIWDLFVPTVLDDSSSREFLWTIISGDGQDDLRDIAYASSGFSKADRAALDIRTSQLLCDHLESVFQPLVDDFDAQAQINADREARRVQEQEEKEKYLATLKQKAMVKHLQSLGYTVTPPVSEKKLIKAANYKYQR